VNRRDAFAPDLRDQAYTAAKNQSRNEDVVSKEKWTFIPNEARERCATIFVEQHRASNQIKPNQSSAAQCGRSRKWLAQAARARNLMALCFFVNDCPIAWRDYVSTITSHLFIRHVHQKIGYRELS
jgi:hypothetical protein